ncbi:hypothetical protein PAHAL_3G122300 [Panicum hallii]|uniref:DUF4220 domain-containing protein n=1 Tax=Panicum hallii TaxID=206008 RepID=A0A2S3H864_9POAL|nr:hypothetical protein PAHAL_3G122300 [Panicum hallii]
MRPLTTGAGGGGGHLMETLRLPPSLVPAVQELWNAWEIHCLILISLSLQVFLLLFGGIRQRSSCWLPRAFLWVAYLSADSVAVFVLGHLAVRASEPGHPLMSFWAPFVLVHLGGQDTITAFSKQDNELYWRHLLNLVTQVAVAGYVVGKVSWPDAGLRAAVALVFLSGCFKYAERIGCLYMASPERIGRVSRHVLSRKLTGREETREAEAVIKTSDLPSLMSKGSSGRDGQFWDAISVLNDVISVDAPLNQTHNITTADDLPEMFSKFMSSESRCNAYEHVGAVLGICYRQLYTKGLLRERRFRFYRRWHSTLPFGIFTWVPIPVALALFMAAEKGDQLTDIWVSYLLLVGAVALDVSSAALFIFSHLANCNKPEWCKKQWSQKIEQYSVIKSAGMWFIKRWLFSCDITQQDQVSFKKFILDTLLVSGARKEWSIASTRGQLALRRWTNRPPREHSGDSTRTTLEALEETVRSGFDFPTSLLIWHIATDICYYSDQVKEHNSHKKMSRELSQYVMYLVFKCGVMLTTNSEIVHDNTREEIKDLSQDDLGEKDVVMRLFQGKEKQQQGSKDEIQTEQHEESEEKQDTDEIQIEREESPDIDSGSYNHMKKLQQSFQALKSSVLPRARAVAQELISIKDEADRWDLVAAVWAEMLYYTAARCGGGFHYEHLSTGGEFVTHVLVLMYLLGPFLPPAYQ